MGILEVQLQEAQRTEGGVSSDGKTLALGEVDQAGLGKVGVVLDLESGRTDTGVTEEIHQQLSAEVANTDAASHLLVHERLHGGPGLLDGSLAQLELVLGVGPAGRVAHAGVNVLQGDGEVHDVKIEVLDAPVSQLLAADRSNALAVVEAVPQLGDNEELLTLDDALLDGTGDTLASLDLVAVVCDSVVSIENIGGGGKGSQGERHTAGAVKETVTGLDGLVDLVGAGVVVDLPEAEAHEGHFVAGAKLNGRSRHFGRRVSIQLSVVVHKQWGVGRLTRCEFEKNQITAGFPNSLKDLF